MNKKKVFVDSAWVLGAILGIIVRFIFTTFVVYLSVQTLMYFGWL